MKLLTKITVSVLIILAGIIASAQVSQSHLNRGSQNPYDPNRPGRIVDEVIFRSSKTAVAVANCKKALVYDQRCYSSNYSCSKCSEIPHSDQSSYVVYDRGNYHAPRRELVNTFDYYDRKTVNAYRKCETARQRTPECSSFYFACSPCTVESHTNHSEFSLYRIVRH